MNNLDKAYLENKKILDKNHAKIICKEAYYQSSNTNVNRTSYNNQKKKQQKARIRTAIASVVLISAIAIPTLTSSLITNYQINNDNAVISIHDVKNAIDDKIKDYKQLMNSSSDLNNKIETTVGHTSETTIVDYNSSNIENLTKHLTNASKISETETRCVVKAAYDIINEPYREEVLNSAFSNININDSELKYALPNNTKDFLEILGYESWKEYERNEVNNIKDLQATIEYVEGKNR